MMFSGLRKTENRSHRENGLNDAGENKLLSPKQRSLMINKIDSKYDCVEESDSDTPRRRELNSVDGDEMNRVIMMLEDGEKKRTVIEQGKEERDGKRLNFETRRFEFEKESQTESRSLDERRFTLEGRSLEIEGKGE